MILHTYTRLNGRMNLVVYGGQATGDRHTLRIPLTLVEISYDNKPNQEMHTLHSFSPLYIPPQQDGIKQLISLFVGEVIYKTLKQPMADERVFDFLQDCIKELNNELTPLQANDARVFVEEFMAKLSVLLGYGGERLDEWKNLNSLDMLGEMLD